MEVLRDDSVKSYAEFVHEDIIEGLEKRISSWPRLKKVIGLVLCFKKKLLDWIRESMSAKG